jgi:uncharacterized protein YggL (DUF469 family)
MKRRLRKKKHLGEFACWGFYIRGSLRADLEDDSLNEFFDWWEDACRKLNVVPTIAFWEPDYFESFLCPVQGSCGEFHRRLVSNWLDAYPGVDVFELGPLIDAWNDPTFRDYERHGHVELGPVSMFWIPAEEYWARGRPASMNAVNAWGLGSVAVFGTPKSRMANKATGKAVDP